MQSDNDDYVQSIEEEYLQCIENENDQSEIQFLTEREALIRNVWTLFQDSATAVAQLYRERQYGSDVGSLWIPFQTAAGTVTKLYKESSDGIKQTNERAIQCGYQRRTKEIAEWAKSKRRRYIRREDLLSYLAGKPPPPAQTFSSHHQPQNHHHQQHHNHHQNVHHNSRIPQNRLSPKPETQNLMQLNTNGLLAAQQHPTVNIVDPTSELHTFKEALAKRTRTPELYTFVAGEIQRHLKRSASPGNDVNMDSPTLNSKRPRFM